MELMREPENNNQQSSRCRSILCRLTKGNPSDRRWMVINEQSWDSPDLVFGVFCGRSHPEHPVFGHCRVCDDRQQYFLISRQTLG